MCLFCVSDHSKYFLKNLLRGWEKLTWSQTPAPLFGLFPNFDRFFIEGFPYTALFNEYRILEKSC